ncbi:MAG: hypothetical protein ACR2PT_00760 [Endozoicomonas sp.]
MNEHIEQHQELVCSYACPYVCCRQTEENHSALIHHLFTHHLPSFARVMSGLYSYGQAADHEPQQVTVAGEVLQGPAAMDAIQAHRRAHGIVSPPNEGTAEHNVSHVPLVYESSEAGSGIDHNPSVFIQQVSNQNGTNRYFYRCDCNKLDAADQ